MRRVLTRVPIPCRPGFILAIRSQVISLSLGFLMNFIARTEVKASMLRVAINLDFAVDWCDHTGELKQRSARCVISREFAKFLSKDFFLNAMPIDFHNVAANDWPNVHAYNSLVRLMSSLGAVPDISDLFRSSP